MPHSPQTASVALNPLDIPVVATTAHGPCIAPERLQLPALRHALAQVLRPSRGMGAPAEEGASDVAGGSARANDIPTAVLIVVVDRPWGPTVLLTQRSFGLRHHAGQISFPGGRIEAHDASAIAAALRETEEEIGLSAQHVEILGVLPAQSTRTGFAITPVVACATALPPLQPQPHEVDAIFELPVRFVLDPREHRQHRGHFHGHAVEFISLQWPGKAHWLSTANPKVERATAEDDAPLAAQPQLVWGATAAMLRSLYTLLIQSQLR